MSKSGDNCGGPVAIRGYLVQTLVALLDIVQADPPFVTITLEPAHADDQFDFVWTDALSTHAVQVKSTINAFSKPEVTAWAKSMEAARTAEHCRLILVGERHAKLDKVRQIGAVAVECKPLDITDIFRDAAHRVAMFAHAQRIDAGTPDQHMMIVEGLITRLLRHSTTREPILIRQLNSGHFLVLCYWSRCLRSTRAN